VRRWVAAAAIALVALAEAGCGSKPLSDKQLRIRATRACATATRLTARIEAPGSPAGTKQFLKQGIAALEPEYRQLRALHPTGDIGRVYEISMSAFGSELAALHTALHALEHGGDPTIAINTLSAKLKPLEASENGAWQTLGIPACVSR
jgi:hypothetical protein